MSEPLTIARGLVKRYRKGSVAVAIFVYASLQAAVDGILFPVKQAGDTRLLHVREKGRANVLASRLPDRLESALAGMPGVAAATGVLTDLASVGAQRVHIFVYGVEGEAYRVFGGMNTMFSAVAHRRREIGILRTVGYRPAAILASFLFESLLIGFAGGLLGAALSFGVARLPFKIPFLIENNVGIGAGNITSGVLLAVGVAVLGGFLPALQAARMQVVLRSGELIRARRGWPYA